MRLGHARLLHCGIAASAWAGVLLGAPIGWAQNEEDTAAARALFAEGRGLAQRSDWEAAADRFRRALVLHPSPAIRYNLASVLTHLGHLVEASEMLRAILRDAPANDRAREPAQALLRETEPRLGRLTIRLRGEAAEAQVTLDGRPVSNVRIGVAVPADPGHHTVVVRRAGAQNTGEVDLAEAGSAEVALDVPWPGAPPSVANPTPAATPPRPAVAAVEPTPHVHGIRPVETAPHDSARPTISETPPPVREPAGDVRLVPVESATAPEAPPERHGVTSAWWFWTALGVVVVGGAVLAVAAAGGGGSPAPISGNAGIVTAP